MSMDSPFSKFAFAQQNGINFPILGDEGGPVASRYGLTQKVGIQEVPGEMSKARDLPHLQIKENRQRTS